MEYVVKYNGIVGIVVVVGEFRFFRIVMSQKGMCERLNFTGEDGLVRVGSSDHAV